MRQLAVAGAALACAVIAVWFVSRRPAPTGEPTRAIDAGVVASVADAGPSAPPHPVAVCETDAGLSDAEAREGAVVDTPRAELRAGPGRNCPVIALLEDGQGLDVLEAPGDPSWLRVRTSEGEGWVEAAATAPQRSEVETGYGLMLRSRLESRLNRVVFSVFLERDGGWEPYETVTGEPFAAPTDFEAKGKVLDLDDDGDADLVFAEYCCGRGTVSVLCSTDAGVLTWAAGYSGSEFDEENELDLPELAGDARSVSVGGVTVALSCRSEREDRRCPEGMRFVRGGRSRRADTRKGVLVPGFCMDTTEVTVAAYARQGQPLGAGSGCNGSRAERRDDPVNCVTFWNARDYCAALGKRLPSDEEWTWAAHGLEPGARRCWNGEGNELGRGKRTKTCRGGSHDADSSDAGIRDLAGNVAEWTSSHVDERYVTRGGSWTDETEGAQRRATESAEDAFADLGFRCAADPSD